MSLIPCGLEDIKRHIKSELNRICAKGYSAEEIHACVQLYENRASAYQKHIEEFSTQIQTAPAVSRHVHSVRFRLKDQFHLADKVVRKCLAETGSRNITRDLLFDPRQGVTDLGAVRILHLRADEWKDLHDYLVNPTSMTLLTVAEKTAYIKPGKRADEYLVDGRFIGNEIKTNSPTGYTSLHYIFKASNHIHKDIFFECQVRTLFEEGWGEIDHQMNYPYKANSIIRGYLDSLNSTAHTANDIASKLETLKHIPLFVRWETEQQLERSADKVFCVTPDLKWVANHLDTFIANVKDSAGGKFYYFILKDDDEAKQNYETVKIRLEAEGLLNIKVWLKLVQKDKSIVPVIADLLLLEKASDPVSRKERDISVVGAPAQREVSQEEHLDMLITEPSAVERMRQFFDTIK